MSTEKKPRRKKRDDSIIEGTTTGGKSREVRATRRASAAGEENAAEWAKRMAREHPLLLIGAGVLAGGVALRVIGVAARIPLVRGLVAGSVVSGLAGWSAEALDRARARLART